MRLDTLVEKAFSGLQQRSLYILKLSSTAIIDLEPSKIHLLESCSNDAYDLPLTSSHVDDHDEQPLHENDDEDELFQQHGERDVIQNYDLENVYLKIFLCIRILFFSDWKSITLRRDHNVTIKFHILPNSFLIGKCTSVWWNPDVVSPSAFWKTIFSILLILL